jgi:hypothetical protein
MKIGEFLSAVEDTMPRSLQFDADDAAVLDHPGEEEFFNQDPAKGPVQESDEQSAEEAERSLQQAGIVTEKTREPVYQCKNLDPETGPRLKSREEEVAVG